MARSELALALARSDAPVPPPEGIVRVPLTGYLPVAALLGTYLGMFLGVFLLLLPPFDGLPRETRQWLVPLTMMGGTAPGALATWALARRRSGGRAIAFDAAHVWIEARGEFADPLPWAGLRLREGRVPHLVAPDRRAIPFRREAMGRGPDARYLAALVETLPRIEVPPRVPTAVLVLVTIAGAVLLWLSGRDRPPLDAEGPFWSPERLRWLGESVASVILLFGGGMWIFLRYGMRAQARAPRTSQAAKPGGETAAYFRVHRFRPPLVHLVEGTTYRYREPELWRGGAKSQREARIALAGMGILFSAAFFGLALFGRPQPSGPLPMVGFGVVSLVFFVGISLLAPFFSRGEASFRIAGDRIYVSGDGKPETSFPWPPRRTREPVDLFDWTDELREGRRRVFLDRRLLVASPPESGNG